MVKNAMLILILTGVKTVPFSATLGAVIASMEPVLHARQVII